MNSIRHSKLKNLHNELFGAKTTNNAVRYLRIFIGHDKEECFNNNWLKRTRYSFSAILPWLKVIFKNITKTEM